MPNNVFLAILAIVEKNADDVALDDVCYGICLDDKENMFAFIKLHKSVNDYGLAIIVYLLQNSGYVIRQGMFIEKKPMQNNLCYHPEPILARII